MVYDVDETADGQMFISMEYLEGETLKKKIERGPLELDQALRLCDPRLRTDSSTRMRTGLSIVISSPPT